MRIFLAFRFSFKRWTDDLGRRNDFPIGDVRCGPPAAIPCIGRGGKQPRVIAGELTILRRADDQFHPGTGRGRTAR